MTACAGARLCTPGFLSCDARVILALLGLCGCVLGVTGADNDTTTSPACNGTSSHMLATASTEGRSSTPADASSINTVVVLLGGRSDALGAGQQCRSWSMLPSMGVRVPPGQNVTIRGTGTGSRLDLHYAVGGMILAEGQYTLTP